jgi:hypothetical protein
MRIAVAAAAFMVLGIVALQGQSISIVSFCGGLQNANNSLPNQPLSFVCFVFFLLWFVLAW